MQEFTPGQIERIKGQMRTYRNAQFVYFSLFCFPGLTQITPGGKKLQGGPTGRRPSSGDELGQCANLFLIIESLYSSSSMHGLLLLI